MCVVTAWSERGCSVKERRETVSKILNCPDGMAGGARGGNGGMGVVSMLIIELSLPGPALLAGSFSSLSGLNFW